MAICYFIAMLSNTLQHLLHNIGNHGNKEAKYNAWKVSVFGVFLACIRTIKTPNTGNSHAVIHIDTKLCNIWSSGVTLIKENKLYFWLRKRHQNKHYLLQFSKIKIWTLPKIISNNGINIFCRIAPKCDKYFQ